MSSPLRVSSGEEAGVVNSSDHELETTSPCRGWSANIMRERREGEREGGKEGGKNRVSMREWVNEQAGG